MPMSDVRASSESDAVDLRLPVFFKDATKAAKAFQRGVPRNIVVAKHRAVRPSHCISVDRANMARAIGPVPLPRYHLRIAHPGGANYVAIGLAPLESCTEGCDSTFGYDVTVVLV